MNVFDLYAKIALDTGDYEKGLEDASGKTSSFADKLKTGLATAAKVGTAAIGAASTAIVALGKIGLDYNSQMEQYTTNFTTMLGSQESAVQKVQELKEFAASTPLSMDDLAKGTQTLLAFGVESENSTGILRQLGDIALGDADKMQRLSTAFGKATAAGKVTGDTVQQMIDAGWNPLIQISQAAGETMEETQKRMSAGAISVEELQAAMEAVTSGTGQFAGGMEAASHTTQGLMSTLQDNAKALVGEVFMPISDGLLGSVLPGAIEAVSTLTTAFRENGISGMIEAAGGIVGSAIGEFTSALPNFVNIAVEIVTSLTQGFSDNFPTIANAAVEVITVLSNGILEMLPEIIKLGLDLIVSLANGISESLPTLIPTIIDVILQIVETLTNPENLTNLISAGISLITSLVEGFVEATPSVIEAIPTIITNLITALLDNIPLLIDAGIKLFVSIVSNIPEIISGIAQAIPEIITGLINAIIEFVPKLAETGLNLIEGLWDGIKGAGDWIWDNVSGFFSGIIDNVKSLLGIHSPSTVFTDVGTNIVKGVWEGIKAMGEWIKEKVSGFFGGIVDSVKGLLGIQSPSKVFAGIGGFMAEGLGEGWDKEYDGIKKKIEDGMDFGTASVGFTASGMTLPYSSVSGGSTGNGIGAESNGQETNIVIPVILDGKQIGEASYKYIRKKERMVGA